MSRRITMSRRLVDDAIPPFPTREKCLEIARRVFGFATRKGAAAGTLVDILGETVGTFRWARNQATTIVEQTDTNVSITSVDRKLSGTTYTNEDSDGALKDAVLLAEKLSANLSSNPTKPSDDAELLGPHEYPNANGYFETTFNAGTMKKSDMAKELVAAAVSDRYSSYGFLMTRLRGRGIANTNNMAAYYSDTLAAFSVTVRGGKSGSGWAGTQNADITKLDLPKIMRRAIDKCRMSENPVRMEPGRHTVILEPQAVVDLFLPAFLPYIWPRENAEMGLGPYRLVAGKSKIGKQMMDRRLTVYSDPLDPLGNFTPFDGTGAPYKKTYWWKEGILTDLPYNRKYAINHNLNGGYALPGAPWHMVSETTPTPLEEMIGTTRRGFLVTRLHGIIPTEMQSLMLTGNTRDGIWYIEDGKIKHPAQNFRFNESPFFAFNQVEEIGQSERTYVGMADGLVTSPYSPSAPPIKVRNFNFTTLADAV
jgi:predicted Zn-dependent protease